MTASSAAGEPARTAMLGCAAREFGGVCRVREFGGVCRVSSPAVMACLIPPACGRAGTP